MSDTEEFITLQEFCRRYAVGRTKAYTLLDQGEVSGSKLGAKLLINVESARQWAARLPPYKSNRSNNVE